MKTTPKKNGGFTLVELIVVIAILAILAAVAIPAYSGYIEKAEKAGDLQILGAINTAFAAACMDNNINQLDIGVATMPIDANGYIGKETLTLSANPSSPKFVSYLVYTNGSVMGKEALIALNNSFALLFSGNEDAQFKAITSNLIYSPAEGGFVALEDYKGEQITVSYAGSQVSVSTETLLALNDSTFGQNMGSDALLNQIGTVTGAAALMAGSLDAVWADDSFNEFAMAALGATTELEYSQKVSALIENMCDPDGDGVEDMDSGDALAQVQANIAVLYASKNAMNYSEQQINDLFKGGAANVKTNLQGANTSEGMAQAALVYGMYTAYANSTEYGNGDLQDKAKNPLTVLNALDNDEDFLKYVNSEQGKTDMAALQGSLGVVVDSTNNNASATTDLLVNGFDNDELKDIMSGLMG